VSERTKQLDRRLIKLETERDRLQEEQRTLVERLCQEEMSLSEWERARDLLVQVLLSTQGKVKSFVEEITTLALSTIYGDSYSFELDYDTRRNQVEATPWIVRDGERYSPRDEVGGGVLDVAALAMRMAIWAITEPRPAATFLLDEPSKFLSEDLQADFGRMLSELGRMLGVQFIVVTHSQEVAGEAGLAYNVILGRDGVSKVERIKL